jgi:hypothetical protein
MNLPIYRFYKIANPNMLMPSLFSAFLLSIFCVHLASAAEERDSICGTFDWNERCDLSPTAHLLVGDVLIAGSIGGVLALIFYRLEHRNQMKIDKILESQQALNERRKDYSVEHLKSMLNLVIFAMSMMRGSITHYNAASMLKDKEDQKWIQSTTLLQLKGEEGKLGRILQNVRTILVASNDVLEPDVVNRIWGVCNYVVGIEVQQKEDGSIEYPKYNVCRLKLTYLIQFLQTYSQANHAFTEKEETYESSGIPVELTDVQEAQQ